MPTARTLALLASLALAAPALARAQGAPPAAPPPSAPAQGQQALQFRALALLQSLQIANAPELAPAINEVLSDTSVHMRMGPRRAATAADTARAREIVRVARAALARYADVPTAERDGYVRFMPWLEEQSVYHYNNIQNVVRTITDFDAARPSSLLYRKDASGRMVLIGAMYSALPSATPEELDARLPLGVAHWHEHVNFCGPTPDSVRAGSQSLDGASLARWLRITSRDECLAAGGRFVPRLFGWMSHVYLFAGDDMDVIWGGEERDHMRMHPHHER